MAGWLISALRLLGIGAGVQAATGLVETVTGRDVPLLGRGPLAIAGGIPEHPHKRRRRRRALTASDRADIGFIVGLLGPTAGGRFAVTLAAR